jgi:hypothetical protein
MVSRRPKPLLVFLSAALFALAITIELVFTATGRHWQGYTFWGGHGPGVALAALWAASIVGLFTRRGGGWIVALCGAFGCVIHGAFLRLASDPWGLAYLAMGAAQVICMGYMSPGYGHSITDQESRRSYA